MCGINFIWDKKGKLDCNAILLMNQANVHRGEDNTSFCKINFQNQQLFFGHNRLKILDLSDNANQPFTDAQNNHILIYNGEIYNYFTLNKDLKKEYYFSTQTDTETLFYFLQKNKLAQLHQLNGMFAFVYFDNTCDKLYIARDAQHIKPLYYFEDENYLIISSEIKSILATQLMPKKLNTKQVGHYLQFRFAKAPETFFQNIFEVNKPFEINLATQEKTYYAYTKQERNFLMDSSNDNQMLNKIENLLIESIERQVRTDVPVGLFLSGGIDSTLLLAIAKELGHELPTFSISNAEHEKNFGTKDYLFANKASKQFQTPYYNILLEPQDLNYIQTLLPKLDQPIADMALVLTYILSQEAKKEVKVALSGAGADELFGGYNRHQAYYFYLKNSKLFTIVSKFKKAKTFLPDGFAHPLRKKFRLLKKLLTKVHSNPIQTLYNFTKLNFNTSKIQGHEVHLDNVASDMLYFDQENFLAYDVLRLSDNMSMLHSLELRVPYLDEALVGLMNSLPQKFIFKNGQKWILKHLLTNRGGKEFCNRPKEGFGFPFGLWIKNKQRTDIVEKLQDSDNPAFEYIKYPYFQKMLKKHLQSKSDYSSEIWAIYLLGEWLKINF